MEEVSYHGMTCEEDQVVGIPSNQNWKDWICNRKRELFLVSVVGIIAIACTVVLTLSLLNAEYSHGTSNENIGNDAKKEKLLKYLHHISDSNTFISGMVTDHLYISSNLQKHWNLAEALPGVISMFLPMWTLNNTEWTSFTEKVILLWNRHHLVTLYLDWSELLYEDTFSNTKRNDKLDFIASHLQKLQNVGVVPILDILPMINDAKMHEFWNIGDGVTKSVNLYKMTQDYLKQKQQITSVIWSWSLHIDYFTENEKYWPGDDYVDVVSVWMFANRQLEINKYQKLLKLVGDKPMSMENMFHQPTTQLFADQSRWTWFSIDESYYLRDRLDRFLLNSSIVINNGNISFFDHTN